MGPKTAGVLARRPEIEVTHPSSYDVAGFAASTLVWALIATAFIACGTILVCQILDIRAARQARRPSNLI